MLRFQPMKRYKNKAVKYFSIASSQGNKDAMYENTNILLDGDGINSKWKKIASYYKMSAEKGNSAAMYKYAYMLEYGLILI